MSSSKKAKTDQQDDFKKVRSYIQECPLVSADHPAILAALKGLDGEIKRQERDAKLRNKFMQDAVAVEKPAAATSPEKIPRGGQESDRVREEKKVEVADEVMADDWQDVTEENSGNPQPEEEGCSFLGQKLAKASIAAMADHSVRVSTPLEALALALHAAMRSEILGFVCTGVPEEKKSNGGFAAPVRELPPHQFLPIEWNKNKGVVALRYRKRATGAVVLTVRTADTDSKEMNAEAMIDVTLVPSSVTEPPSLSLSFPLKEHLNLDSWERAFKENNSFSPALHYKSLATLLSNFAKTFDLGSVMEEGEAGVASSSSSSAHFPYVDSTVSNLPTRLPGQQVPELQYPQRAPEFQFPGGTPTRDEFAFPGSVRDPSRRPGDFAGDLAPGGMVPGPHGPHPDSGMVMGPNHPLFTGGLPSNGGMRPRFDPFGPPGGPTEPEDDQPPGPLPPSRTGNRQPVQPNRDHMRPPNFFNSGNTVDAEYT